MEIKFHPYFLPFCYHCFYSDHYRILWSIDGGFESYFFIFIFSPCTASIVTSIKYRVPTHMSSFLFSHHCIYIVTTISTINRSCRVSTHNYVFIFRDLNRSVLLKCVSLDCCYHVSKAESSLTSQQHAVVLRAIYEMVVNYS